MSTKPVERRAVIGLQIRASAAGDEMALVGRAASYNVLSKPGVPFPGYREKLIPGCFKASMDRADVVYALHNHDSNRPLGKTGAGLILADDVSSLNFRVVLNPEVQLHKDVYELTKSGVIDQCSFGFICEDESTGEETDDTGARCMVRYVKRATLMDVSVLSCAPAYGGDATMVAARSLGTYDLSSSADLRARLARITEQIDGQTDRANRDRLARITAEMTVSSRATAADSEPDQDDADDLRDMQDALTARFGKANNGLTPRYWALEMHSNHVVCMDMSQSDLTYCSIPYSCDDDDDDYEFGEPEKTNLHYAPAGRAAVRARAASAAKTDSAIRFRMECAAGRR